MKLSVALTLAFTTATYASDTSTSSTTSNILRGTQTQQQQQQQQHEFNFVQGQTHSISDGTVSSDFCDETSPRSLSGFLDITGSKYNHEKIGSKHYFYWFFEKRAEEIASDKNIPLIVWLTGGPGCSSIMALLTENGPCSVNDKGTGTVNNPFSWTESAHMLWLDQPANVGYSYGAPNDNNEEMIAEDAYYFLQSFFKAHPEYSENPLFIVGESYGGHYAPAIAYRAHKGNQESKENTIPLNLKGVAIGNGLTHPEIQYQYYPDMAYKNSHDIQVVGAGEHALMEKAAPKCAEMIHNCNDDSQPENVELFACQQAFAYCNMALTSPYQLTGLSPYNIKAKCEVPPLCDDYSNVEKFMNSKSTKKALNAAEGKGKAWQVCNMGINMEFHVDWMKSQAPHVKALLDDADIPVLIYAGDLDYICNYLGNRAWTLDLDWKHKEEFNAAEEHEWNDKTGLARSSNGFTFLQVYDAGHMVPGDQPEVSLTMITDFIQGKEF